MGKEKWVAGVAPQVNPLLASGYRITNADCPLERVPVSDAFLRDQQKILEILDSKPEVPLVPKATFPGLAFHRVALQDACEDGMGGVCIEGGVVLYFIEP